MKHVSFYLGITSLIMIFLGVLCILHPQEIFLSMTWILGLLVFLSGLFTTLVGVYGKGSLPNASSTMLVGVIQLLVGLIFMCKGFVAGTAIIVVFALWVMIEGVSLAAHSLEYRRIHYSRWWVMFLLGLSSLVLGFVALHNIEPTSQLIGILIGLGIFANGVVRLIALIALKYIKGQVQEAIDDASAINIDDINSIDEDK